jgi:hypothetical protein
MARGGKRDGAGRKPGVSKATLLKRRIQDYVSETEVKRLIAIAKAQVETKPELLKFLLEQIFGKAPQRMEVSGKDGAPVVVEISGQVAAKHGLNTRAGRDSE